MASDAPRTRRWSQETSNHLHGGRLASPIGAEETEYLATFYREADMVDGNERSEPPCQIFDFNHTHRRQTSIPFFDTGFARRTIFVAI